MSDFVDLNAPKNNTHPTEIKLCCLDPHAIIKKSRQKTNVIAEADNYVSRQMFEPPGMNLTFWYQGICKGKLTTCKQKLK